VLIIVSVFGADEALILGNEPADPDFKAIENQFLIFPFAHKDLENWETKGTTVFLRNKVVITP